MDGINKVLLVGTAGADVEIKNISGGKTLYVFSLATNESYRKGEEKVTNTEWHRIKAWDLKICEHVKKGDVVSIIGKIKTNAYEKDGETKKSVEIVANEVILFGRFQKDIPESTQKEQKNATSKENDSFDLPMPDPIDSDELPF